MEQHPGPGAGGARSWPSPSWGGGGGSVTSVVLAILSALFFATYAVWASGRPPRWAPSWSPRQLPLREHGAASPPSWATAMAAPTGPWGWTCSRTSPDPGPHRESLPYLLFIGIVSTGLGYVFHMFAIEKTSATHGSLVFSSSPSWPLWWPWRCWGRPSPDPWSWGSSSWREPHGHPARIPPQPKKGSPYPNTKESDPLCLPPAIDPTTCWEHFQLLLQHPPVGTRHRPAGRDQIPAMPN